MEGFFIISGIMFWICVLILIISMVKESDNQESDDQEQEEFFCHQCNKDTIHNIIGDGFNTSEECTLCHEMR